VKKFQSLLQLLFAGLSYTKKTFFFQIKMTNFINLSQYFNQVFNINSSELFNIDFVVDDPPYIM